MHEQGCIPEFLRRVRALEGVAQGDDDELVSADATDHAAGSEAALQCSGDAKQKLIPRLVAVAVVDEFESVQIDDADKHVFAVALSQSEQLYKIAHDAAPIGESCQRIGQSQPSQFGIGGLQLCDQEFALQGVAQQARQQRKYWLHVG